MFHVEHAWISGKTKNDSKLFHMEPIVCRFTRVERVMFHVERSRHQSICISPPLFHVKHCQVNDRVRFGC
jgi:hypothetical protein